MSKPALRFLSLGFLVSALILASYRSFFYESQSADATDASTELTQEDETYKAKYESLLAETELAKMESEYAVDEQDSETTDEEATEESSENDAEESSSTEEETSSEATTATIIINNGDPSSIAARQLQEQGIIEDSAEFDNFLEDNNLSNLIRPGTFTIESGMSFQEIADILSSEN
ncbi:hypothetical protein JTF06_04925 [Desemzia sp. RIT804]|uniref:hypothetical protein n=1 Tax=Desemzia sp. RIT 804 TaxID=2810209 RepID=UPI00194F04F5|nr:hypothetical protein [Desemzia sp. RIT 804]MBM6614229.1 hypothetical protein [Desemzia sp. RIT 804]